jgi:hypothetical protein
MTAHAGEDDKQPGAPSDVKPPLDVTNLQSQGGGASRKHTSKDSLFERRVGDGNAGVESPHAEGNTARSGHDSRNSPQHKPRDDGTPAEPTEPLLVRSPDGHSGSSAWDKREDDTEAPPGSERSAQGRSHVDGARMNLDHGASEASSSSGGESSSRENMVEKGEAQRAARKGLEVNSAKKVPRLVSPSSEHHRQDREDCDVANKKLQNGELTPRTRDRRDFEQESGRSPRRSEERREDGADRRVDSVVQRDRPKDIVERRGQGQDTVEGQGWQDDSADRRGQREASADKPRSVERRGCSSISIDPLATVQVESLHCEKSSCFEMNSRSFHPG